MMDKKRFSKSDKNPRRSFGKGRSEGRGFGKPRGFPAKDRQNERASEFPGERIAKVIARVGFGSRRDAEEAIEQGRVSVNGRVLESPAFNVTESDRILLDGRPLPQKDRTRLWLYHKPRGLVTTESDPEGRQTVFETLPRDMPRVLSVGRLDVNTEGLLLLTNDGGLKRVLELPATGWLRRYRVRAFGEIQQYQLDALKNGIEIDGVNYGPVEASIERQTGDNIWLLMAIREGKNREIKRIAEHLGLQVNRLIRVSFGPFQLKDLKPGDVQEASLRTLKEQLGARLMREAGVDFSKSNTAIHPRERLEKHGRAAREEGSATGKAERFARLQGDDRHIERDEVSQQLKLQPKKLRDRKGRDIEVMKSPSQESYLKRKKRREDGEAEAPRSFRPGNGKRPYRARSEEGERRHYRASAEGEKRTYRPRSTEGDSSARKPYRERKDYSVQRDGEKRPYRSRSNEAEKRAYRPRSAENDPPARKPYRERKDYSAQRDSEKRPYRPREKNEGERPYRSRSQERPYQKRESPGEDRPFRKTYVKRDEKRFDRREDEKRPYRPRGAEGDKRPYRSRSDEGEKRPYRARGGETADRPFRKSSGDRSERSAGEGFKKRGFGKPSGGFKKSFGGKPGGKGRPAASRGASSRSGAGGKKNFSKRPPRRG